MENTYLLAAILGTAAVILFGVVLKMRQRHPGTVSTPVSVSGLAVSDKVRKDSRLSSDFILSAIQDGVVMVGNDRIISVVNPAAATITGWTGQEAVGLEFGSVIVLVDEKGQARPPDSNPFNKALSTANPVKESEAWLATKNGKKVPISLIVSPLHDPSGQPTGSVVGVFRDITAEKEEASRRSDFVSTASHEMRTPIAAIEGYLALALNEKIAKVDDNGRKYLEKASAATKHLGILFQDLLTSTKAEDGRLASYPTVVEMGEVVERILDEEKIRAKEKGLDLKFEIGGNQDVNGGKVVRPIYYAHLDPHRIEEVIQNLVDNAVKYTMQGGITVRLTGDPNVIQIQVQDTGQGIPDEDIPHLFQKFYRVDSSLTRSVGGTGLGLFICKKIIELYNGQIWVESSLGKGSTFFINLPRLNATQALEMQRQQSATISPLDPAASRN